MIHQRVFLPCDWMVDIYYDTRPSDADYIIDKLWNMGCATKHLHKAQRLLRSGVRDEGLTYSNHFKRQTLIAVGHVTDVFEFFNSLSHEKQHLEQAICIADYLDPYGEEIAYISGEITESLARSAWAVAKHLIR